MFRRLLLLPISAITLINSQQITSRLDSSIKYELKYQDTVLKDYQNSYIPCFISTDFNRMYGCQSSSKGNSGPVELYENVKNNDIEQMRGKILVINSDQFDVELSNILLAGKTSEDTVKGIIVSQTPQTINERDNLVSFQSENSRCPNAAFSMYGYKGYGQEFENCQTGPVWNSDSNQSIQIIQENSNFNNKYFPFPIFFIQNSTHINKIKNCYQSTKNKFYKCTIRMKSRQHASKNTKSCIRKESMNVDGQQRCKPLGGTSVYSQLLESNVLDQTDRSKTISENVVFVTTKIDSKTNFWELAPGQGSVIGNLVILMATIKNLGQIFKNQEQNFSLSGSESIQNKLSKQVAFNFLDGEEYGYIASSKFAFLMNNDSFPMKFENLNSAEKATEIEIEKDEGESARLDLQEKEKLAGNDDVDRPFSIQLKNLHTVFEIGEIYPLIGDNFYLHNDQIESASVSIRSKEEVLINKLISGSSNSSFLQFSRPSTRSQTEVNGIPLPPSSIHSFKKYRKEINGIILSDFERNYQNKFLGSPLDIFSQDIINNNILETENLAKFNALVKFVTLSILRLAADDSKFTEADFDQIKSFLENDSVILETTQHVKDLLNCFLVLNAPSSSDSEPNQNLCQEFKTIFPPVMFDLPQTQATALRPQETKKLDKIQFRYVGVLTSHYTKLDNDNLMLSYLLSNYIGKYLGDEVAKMSYDEVETYRQEQLKDKTGKMMSPGERICSFDNGTTAPDFENRTIAFVQVDDLVNKQYICYKLPSYQTIMTSVSPIFNQHLTDFNDVDFNENDLKHYSTYAESMWDPNSFEFLIFYSAPESRDVWHLILGILMFASFYGVNWFVTERSDILFGLHF